MLFKKILVVSVLAGSTFFANAAELNHKFINPNFGGNPFNAGPLLNNATAQNKYKDPDTSKSSSRSSAESFRERLDRSILSRLSRVLVDNAFGEDGEIIEGDIETGLNTISVEEIPTGALVTITNNETGETTVIEVPSF
ncbi:MAG: curli assembly protein CsgF [Methylococcales bacterium]